LPHTRGIFEAQFELSMPMGPFLLSQKTILQSIIVLNFPGGVQNLGLPNVGKHAPATPAPLAPKIKNFADM